MSIPAWFPAIFVQLTTRGDGTAEHLQLPMENSMSSSVAHRMLCVAGAMAMLSLIGSCVPSGYVPPFYVTVGSLNFRAGPSDGAPIITSLAPGTIVQPTGPVSGGWWQVNWNGTIGWVYSRYLAPA